MKLRCGHRNSVGGGTKQEAAVVRRKMLQRQRFVGTAIISLLALVPWAAVPSFAGETPKVTPAGQPGTQPLPKVHLDGAYFTRD